MHSRRNRLLARGTSAVLLGIGALALVHSLGWRGARFPGFFVMPNRVVPSAALPGWSGVADGRPLYQNILLAVDDVPIAAAEGTTRFGITKKPGKRAPRHPSEWISASAPIASRTADIPRARRRFRRLCVAGAIGWSLPLRVPYWPRRAWS